MITALKTIIGLIFDDWWMAIGLLISILITYFAIQSGMDVQMSGWLLLILMIGALILSLNVEYRKKSKKR
jgi:FtsH-binding integral membrane protein